MALVPYTPWGNDDTSNPDPTPAEEITAEPESWATLTVEESDIKKEPLPDYVPYIGPVDDKSTDIQEVSLEPAEEEDDPVPTASDLYTVIDEMGMPYRIGKAFELLYNIKTTANLIESAYKELESYFKAAIRKYEGDFYSTAAECTQNPDLTLALWGVDYAVGCMMKNIMMFCIQGTTKHLKEALAMLYTVGIAV